jgi:hypothetical protein
MKDIAALPRSKSQADQLDISPRVGEESARRYALDQLPPLYWPVVMAIIGCYAILTHVTKVWFVRRWGL